MSQFLMGRPQNIGGLFHEEGRLKFNIGYCPNCKLKLGMTNQELENLALHIPGRAKTLLWKLCHLRIIFPK